MDLTVLKPFVSLAVLLVRRNTTTRQLEHRVLMTVAGTNGRAAAQALRDAHNSSDPQGERLQALTLLRSAYQTYLEQAENITPTLWDRLRHKHFLRTVADARFNAALCALAMARIYQIMRNRKQKNAWRDLARDHYLTWRDLSSTESLSLPETAYALLEPSADEATELTDDSPTCPDPVGEEQLRQEFEDTWAALHLLPRRARLGGDQPV